MAEENKTALSAAQVDEALQTLEGWNRSEAVLARNFVFDNFETVRAPVDVYNWIDANTRFAPGDLRAATPRFAPENLAHNMQLVDLIKTWAVRKRATPAQIALAWLMAQKPWIVPIPGTTVMQHMLENAGAATVRFTPAEIAELNSAVRAIEIRGQRLPDAVLLFSGVEAPPKK